MRSPLTKRASARSSRPLPLRSQRGHTFSSGEITPSPFRSAAGALDRASTRRSGALAGLLRGGTPRPSGGRDPLGHRAVHRAGPRDGAQIRPRALLTSANCLWSGSKPAGSPPALPQQARRGGLRERDVAVAGDPGAGLHRWHAASASLAGGAPRLRRRAATHRLHADRARVRGGGKGGRARRLDRAAPAADARLRAGSPAQYSDCSGQRLDRMSQAVPRRPRGRSDVVRPGGGGAGWRTARIGCGRS